jgi:hypothetical protein
MSEQAAPWPPCLEIAASAQTGGKTIDLIGNKHLRIMASSQ